MSAYDPSDPGAVLVDILVDGFPAPFMFRPGEIVERDDRVGVAPLDVGTKVRS